MLVLVVLDIRQARYDEAETLLLEAVEGRIEKLGPQHPQTKKPIRNLIRPYEAWDKPEHADQWQAKLSQTETVEQ